MNEVVWTVISGRLLCCLLVTEVLVTEVLVTEVLVTEVEVISPHLTGGHQITPSRHVTIDWQVMGGRHGNRIVTSEQSRSKSFKTPIFSKQQSTRKFKPIP